MGFGVLLYNVLCEGGVKNRHLCVMRERPLINLGQRVVKQKFLLFS